MTNYESTTHLSEATLHWVQKLIQLNIDSRDGLYEVAKMVEDSQLTSFLRELGDERNQQVSELRSLVSANRQEPISGGTLTAAVHRTWIDLRAAFGGGASALLVEAERGELQLVGIYEQAIRDVVAETILPILHRHRSAVDASLQQVRELRAGRSA